MSSPRSVSPSGSGSDGYSDYDQYSTSDTRNGDHPGSASLELPSSFQSSNLPSNQNRLTNGKLRAGGKPKRPTHFLCFPLITESSVPQLADSLRRFRDITTATPTSNRYTDQETPERDIDDSRADTTIARDSDTQNLRLIPASAHRPPGTFHLTIGVMDLSEKSQLQKAFNVLKSIDYNLLLREVDEQLRINGTRLSQREIAMDALPSDSPSRPSATNPGAIDQPSSPATNPNRYRETVSRIDRAIMHATPNSPPQRPTPTPDEHESYHNSVSRIDRVIVHATPDTREFRELKKDHRRELSQASQNSSPSLQGLTNHRNSSQDSNLSALTTGSSIAPLPTSPRREGHTGNMYGVSGYKETVSTIDRYVDKTYDAAQKAKVKAKTLKPREIRERIRTRSSRSGTLENLKRDVSPPPSLASTTHRRLLDGRSSVGYGSVVGDGDSLYTVTTNATDATERPSRPPVSGLADAATHRQPLSSSVTPALSDSPSTILITLRGLQTFPSANKARVFYAPPNISNPDRHNSPDRLLLFANAIRDIFSAENLIDENRELVLHATVANTTYASKTNSRDEKDGERGKGRGKRGYGRGKPPTLDANSIIKYFNHRDSTSPFVWAENILVNKVRICKMGAENSDDSVLGKVYPAIEVDIDETADQKNGYSGVSATNGTVTPTSPGQPQVRRETKVQAEVVFA